MDVLKELLFFFLALLHLLNSSCSDILNIYDKLTYNRCWAIPVCQMLFCCSVYSVSFLSILPLHVSEQKKKEGWANDPGHMVGEISALTSWSYKPCISKPFFSFPGQDLIIYPGLCWHSSNPLQSAFMVLVTQVGTATPNSRTRKFKEKMVTWSL